MKSKLRNCPKKLITLKNRYFVPKNENFEIFQEIFFHWRINSLLKKSLFIENLKKFKFFDFCTNWTLLKNIFHSKIVQSISWEITFQAKKSENFSNDFWVKKIFLENLKNLDFRLFHSKIDIFSRNLKISNFSIFLPIKSRSENFWEKFKSISLFIKKFEIKSFDICATWRSKFKIPHILKIFESLKSKFWNFSKIVILSRNHISSKRMKISKIANFSIFGTS